MFTIDFNDHTNLVKDEWYHQIEDLINFAKEKKTFMKMLNCQLFL